LRRVLLATAVIVAMRRVVDVLSLGDLEAASLGVDVRPLRASRLVAATVGTAAAVAVCQGSPVGIVSACDPTRHVGHHRGLLPPRSSSAPGFRSSRTPLRAARSRHGVPIGVITALSAPRSSVRPPRRPGVSAIGLDRVTVHLEGRAVVRG
jgi:iron complex transport system permease protein